MDESRMGEWLEGYKSMELIEGEPLTVGSKHKLVFEEDGQEMTFTETVTAIEPLKEFSFDFDHDMMSSSIQMTLESTLGLRRRASRTARSSQANGFFINLLHVLHDAEDERQTAQELRPIEGVDRIELMS